MMYRPSIAIVTTTTRMQGLLQRWGTKGAARFRLNQAVSHQSPVSKHKGLQATPTLDDSAQAFSEYEREDLQYQQAVEQIRRDIDLGYPVTMVPRQHLANFDFSSVVAVLVIGQDGLIANTAKYAMGLPLIGINPDPATIDGILVPFTSAQARPTLQRVLKDAANVREVTMAQATTNDGQSMLAFNDFFIGRKSHASARYILEIQGNAETQSSSGIIIATGAGSTGWLSSIFHMMSGFQRWLGGESRPTPILKWEDRKLAWVVREPFRSKHSGVQQVAGFLDEHDRLSITSLMPDSGVLFSDGIESDFLEFNSGSSLNIQIANQIARLVVP